MRYSDLTQPQLDESTASTVAIITAISDVMLDRLSKRTGARGVIPEKSQISVNFYDLSYYLKDAMMPFGELGELVVKYFRDSDTGRIIFINNPSLSADAFGSYNIATRMMCMNAHRIAYDIGLVPESGGDIDFDALIKSDSIYQKYNGGSADFSFVKVLKHEIRHLMQHVEFSRFMHHNMTQWVDYSTQHIEIDAEFAALVAHIDPAKYDSAKKYTDYIMKMFSSYKVLSPKQFEDYTRKTMRYWADITNPQKDIDTMTAKDKLVAQKDAAKKFIIGVLKAYAPSLSDTADFRQIAGYDETESGNFLFPAGRAVTIIANVLNNDSTPTVQTKTLMYLMGALATSNPDRHYAIMKFMIKTYQFTPEMAADAIGVDTLGIPYDFDTLSALIRKPYQ